MAGLSRDVGEARMAATQSRSSSSKALRGASARSKYLNLFHDVFVLVCCVFVCLCVWEVGRVG